MANPADDDAITQASSSRLPVMAQPRVRPPTAAPGSQSTVGSPLEALERDEIMRTRRFAVIGIVIAVLGGLSVPLLPGDPTASVLVLAAVGMSIMAILFLLSRSRDPVSFRKPSTGLGWFIPAACVTTAIPFFGAFSPAPLVLVLGIYFTGLGKSWRLAFAVYYTCAGMQALVGALVIAGAHDTGLITAPQLSRIDQIVIQMLVQIVLAATLVTARMSRRTALIAVGELEHAVRVAAHREALLLEAREELERALRPGRGRFSDQTIGGYQLGVLIGRGAMGEVYEAQGPSGTVAVKLLSQASLGNPGHVLRFLRELRTAAAIDSPHVVKVLDIGEQPVPYLVMERLEGKTLTEILRGSRALSTDDIVEMIAQVGRGVTAAGDAGIVHRDLKPQNVFHDRGARWLILDFGIARAIDAGDSLTAGHIVGTPTYMAPEQASGSTVDHRTDLYALAAIAYRALTGQPPYAAGELAETLYRVVHTVPRRPSELAELPVEVDVVLAIGLAKEPGARFQSARELADALADAFTGTLPGPTRRHGETLIRDGAWKVSKRQSTARMRVPR
ncbi:MAG TPA: serine/threonine-protein kinase [Kofleriaceae bacterium]|nr:serine/threonine-protein kinase [Kofleriaceae bacterium]